jgi:hypothetical protein
LFALIARQPDLTLDEIVVATAAEGSAVVAARRGAFSATQDQPPKKCLRAAEQERADVARARRRWTREQGMFEASSASKQHVTRPTTVIHQQRNDSSGVPGEMASSD